jgi:hypothetical protein
VQHLISLAIYSPLILSNSTGLVFFATPHAGGQGQLVKLGDYIAKFAMSLNVQRGDKILEILKSSSLAADTLREHWRHRLDKVDIVSFWGNRDSVCIFLMFFAVCLHFINHPLFMDH